MTEYYDELKRVNQEINNAIVNDDFDLADELQAYLNGLKKGRRLTKKELKP